MSVMTLPPSPLNQESKSVLQSVPAWASSLYQNFVLPALSPNLSTEWFNLGTPFGGSGGGANNSQPDAAENRTSQSVQNGQSSQTQNTPRNMEAIDYFTQAWEMSQPRVQTPAGADLFNNSAFNNMFMYQNPLGAAISTSLLVSQPMSQASTSNGYWPQPHIPVATDSPVTDSYEGTPNMSPKGKKRRASSMDSDEIHSHDEVDHEVPEGVERDGMIWGMKVEDYRALSARERKRVRNRISARTFRAKRKEHLSSLEHTINNKDMQIKRAQDEAARLRQEVLDLKRRLAKYEQ